MLQEKSKQPEESWNTCNKQVILFHPQLFVVVFLSFNSDLASGKIPPWAYLANLTISDWFRGAAINLSSHRRCQQQKTTWPVGIHLLLCPFPLLGRCGVSSNKTLCQVHLTGLSQAVIITRLCQTGRWLCVGSEGVCTVYCIVCAYFTWTIQY